MVVLCQQFLECYLKHLLEVTQGKSVRHYKLALLANQLGFSELDKYEDFLEKFKNIILIKGILENVMYLLRKRNLSLHLGLLKKLR